MINSLINKESDQLQTEAINQLKNLIANYTTLLTGLENNYTNKAVS